MSNRLPFSLHRAARRWRADPASGGLVTALLPVLRDRGGTWVGWAGAPGAVKDFAPALRALERDAGYALVGVPLGEAEVRDFYHGFANEVIWPLFHDLPSFCSFAYQI